MKTREARAFTLIELLIVVAIIAILAAIAVPNFLEAQVRAKVSRVKSDMRSLATAIETYRIDRMLTQLSSAGFLDKLNGVVLGHFDVPARRRFPADRPWQDLLGEAFGSLGIPVISGLPAGHTAGKWTLPLGGMASLNTTSRQLRIDS